MNHLVISDIHGNLEALEAVIKDANKNGGFEDIVCLGDIVGYGPNPHEVIELLRGYKVIGVRGNHEAGMLGDLSELWFNPTAWKALLAQRKELTISDLSYLSIFPLIRIWNSFTLVHSTPIHPEEFFYARGMDNETMYLSVLRTPYCLVGHTHVPMVFTRNKTVWCPEKVTLGKTMAILNPGSVGQPRDGDNRAAYGLLDLHSKTMEYHKVNYDIRAVAMRLWSKKMPIDLGVRLFSGE